MAGVSGLSGGEVGKVLARRQTCEGNGIEQMGPSGKGLTMLGIGGDDPRNLFLVAFPSG